MVDHVVQWQARFSQEANHNPSTFHLESNRFALAIGWLVRKCLIVWPDLLPNLARPTADFIKSIPLVASRNRYTHGYKCQCHIFNSAIESLGEEPAADRQRAREFCWEAQKILLECSSTSHRQLIISRNSYRSIRMVMLSLKKTALETKVAIRSSTSWPPYRKVWDGTDERRKPEDDLSRASQAGILMHEAGYSSDWDDEAMTVLGGSFSGRPPTVQTRTLDFKFSDNPDTLWIARINATRNAREAWGVFQSPPVSGMLPTTGVYAAMFAKLYSPPVDMAGVVPGDTTRVFPVDNGNLSPFAITSLEPPDPKSLYQRMLNQRLAPTGLCLQLLIRNADDIEEAMEYFRKSPYSSAAPVLEVSLEALSESDLNDFDNPSLHWKRKMLSSIPPGILAAWISALCRIRPNWRRLIRPCYISNAVFLARLHKSTTPPGSRDSAPLFREIATFLGRGKMVRPTRGEHKAASTLRVFLVVYSQFSFVCKGADERMFQAFCLILQKTVRSFLFLTKAGSQKVKTRGWRRATERVHSETFLLEPCCNGVVQEFKLLVQPLDTDKTTPSIIYPHPRFPLRTAVTLQLYMRALAAFGNAEEMVRVVEWLFDSYETGLVFSRELMTPGAYEYRVLVNTLAYFDCIIEKLGDSSTQRHLRERLQFLQDERGCTWYLHELQENLRQCIEEDLLCAKAYKGLTAGWTSSSLPPPSRTNISVDLPQSSLVTPRPHYHGFIPPAPLIGEREALAALMEALERQGDKQNEDFIEFDLDQFAFYINSDMYPLEMRPLHNLSTKNGHGSLYFDGILSHGDLKFYLRKVEVIGLPIGNYGVSNHSVVGHIWVRSRRNAQTEIYYRLKKPAIEYSRYHTPFLWIADLAKHVVDFCSWMLERKQQITIMAFQEKFIKWALKAHGTSQSFRQWRQKHSGDDFRTSVGDTISTPRDHEDITDTKWERMSSKDGVEDERWFGLVQRVHTDPRNGSKSFDVTWFYRPVETPCCMMRYPWPNELFLSDHCTCEEGPSARVKGREILATHSVDWFGDPSNPKGEFVVRQLYVVQKRRWITLSQSHLRCKHDPLPFPFRVGDTVLVSINASEAEPVPLLETCEVVKIFKQEQMRFVRLRKLVRRKDVDPRAQDAAPNELVYTNRLVVKKALRIVGKCCVRFVRPNAPIPVPYNKGGTGNMFFITTQLKTSDDGVSTCDPFDGEFPTTLRQGFDPDHNRAPKLRGLDLFCGSGNFGRGLEEGGVVEMRWANDIWDKAIHTYMANCPTPETTRPFLGSVDDLLELAMEGKFADNVPRPGEVDFISGGSPCPGFSRLTADKTTLTQVKNQSLVASFASFVDFYRPQYGILENVCTIVQSNENRKQDVLSQLFCALVGLGYQAQLIMGDAWSHGAPQSRSRVFLYFAAPGLSLPEAPRPSHSHVPRAKNHALGKMCNGEPFVSRMFGPTPFTYVSAAESTADLPPIYDSTPDSCIPFPDHRLSVGPTYERRREFALIPTHPSGLGFAKAWNQGKGVMTPAERDFFPPDGAERVNPISAGWSRVRPNDIFGTVTTACNPTDSRLGAGLHWAEDRPLSIQEVRRAQGFPDEEVLVGNRTHQWKLVGNSVARQLAIALGLQFREAWLGSLYDDSWIGVKTCVGADVPTLREVTPATMASNSSTATPRSGSSRGTKRVLTSLLNEMHVRETKRRCRDGTELATSTANSFDGESPAVASTPTGESLDEEGFAPRGFAMVNPLDEGRPALPGYGGSSMDEMFPGMEIPIEPADDMEGPVESAGDKISGLTVVRL
ncbi:hypothetical protein V8F33_001588 [Rhypophila sp. PSN 637]